jgi:CubicO group peptidase (beta-lactamase class C family)
VFSNPALNHAQLITLTLKNRPLDYPPGEHYAYSNFGYCVLGRIIEKITGQPYADYVRAALLGRCSVTDMTIAGNTLAQRSPQRSSITGEETIHTVLISRGWILIARPADYVQFVMHVDGFAKPRNILNPQTIQTMTTPSPANAGYAKGWTVNKADNWWHTGSLPGTSSVEVRTHTGFCWATFINTRRLNSALNGDLDKLNWSMVRQVRGWRV